MFILQFMILINSIDLKKCLTVLMVWTHFMNIDICCLLWLYSVLFQIMSMIRVQFTQEPVTTLATDLALDLTGEYILIKILLGEM